MSPIVALFGPHAIGKTTAARRWAVKYRPKLTTISADNQLEYDGCSEIRVRGWQGSLADKHQLLKQLRDRSKVFLIESCSSYGTQILRGLLKTDYVIHVHCSPKVMLDNLRNRALKRGKQFNAPYWDQRRLKYESYDRLHNCAKTYGLLSQVVEFKVDNYEEDWPVVDEYFGSLFRKLHNAQLASA